MHRDIVIFSGTLALPLIATTTLLFGYLEPNYSHTHHAVSELGAYSAKHTLAMNFFGLFMPGLLIVGAFLKATLCTEHPNTLKAALYLMIIFGLMFAGLAAPMDMEPIPTLGVTFHYILANVSVVPFLLACLLVASSHLKTFNSSFVSCVLILLPLVFITARASAVLDLPEGLIQRGLLLCIFSWVAIMCFTLSHRI